MMEMTLPPETWYSRPMDAFAVARRARKLSLGGTLMALVMGAAVGCDQAGAQTEQQGPTDEKTQPAESKNSAMPSSVAAPSAAAPSAGQAAYDEEAFQLTIEAPAPAKAATPLTLKVVLVAKNGYKINDEYPIKFKLDESPSVRATKETVRKEDATVEKMRVEMPVQITVAQPGAVSISGRLSFSVCTDERCLIEKRDLKMTFNAT